MCVCDYVRLSRIKRVNCNYNLKIENPKTSFTININCYWYWYWYDRSLPQNGPTLPIPLSILTVQSKPGPIKFNGPCSVTVHRSLLPLSSFLYPFFSSSIHFFILISLSLSLLHWTLITLQSHSTSSSPLLYA